MWKILLKNSSRQLLRNKLFTLLNIIGLTISISACWVIYKYVSFELSFENGMPNKDKTYRLFSQFGTVDNQTYNGGVSRPIYFAMQEQFEELAAVVAVFQVFTEAVVIPAYDQVPEKKEAFKMSDQAVFQTDPAYFEMLPYTWLAGSPNAALQSPNEVILTEKKAKLYFPTLSFPEIIGKSLIYLNGQQDSVQMTVTGVVSALPYNSEFIGEEFYRLQKTEQDNQLNQWTNTNGSDKVYFQAKDPKTAAQALQKLQNLVAEKWQLYKQETQPTYSYSRSIQMMPLTEAHFSTFLNEFGPNKTSKTVIYSLIGIAAFLILLACINYINLTTAQMPQRNKEIGIRKTLGSSGKQLVLQILLETGIILLISLCLSFFVSRLGIALLGDLISKEMLAYTNYLAFFIFIFGILFITLILSGLYPAWLITQVNAIDLFRNKGQVKVGKQNLNLRKGLIVFQFVVAQLFIIASLIVGQQLRYVIKKDMGFNKEAVLVCDLPYSLVSSENFHNKKQTLAQEINKIPHVQQVSLGVKPLANSYSSSSYTYKSEAHAEPKSVNIFLKAVDSEYLALYDLQLIAGKNFLPADTTNSFVINESAVKAFGFASAEEALGKFIGQEPRLFPIIGVVKDFHQRDFYTAIEPIALSTDMMRANSLNIKLAGTNQGDWPSTIQNMEAKLKSFFPKESFSIKFYDESIAALYKKEQQLHKFTNISMTVAIIISCLGLFGLATITAFQRSKEIGIRKVLGASVTGIVSMLSKDFVKMVLIAMLIASPIVYWACIRWLESFVYRIEISWVPFMVGGAVALLAALLTVSYQAIKVARTKPVESLRDE